MSAWFSDVVSYKKLSGGFLFSEIENRSCCLLDSRRVKTLARYTKNKERGREDKNKSSRCLNTYSQCLLS